LNDLFKTALNTVTGFWLWQENAKFVSRFLNCFVCDGRAHMFDAAVLLTDGG
jgi:hypothetical protein